MWPQAFIEQFNYSHQVKAASSKSSGRDSSVRGSS